MLKKSIIFILLTSVFLSCKKSYDPENLLTARQKDSLLTTLIIQMDKLQAGANMETRFEEKFREGYEQRKKLFSLDQYYIDKDGFHYFMVIRRVPSLYEANKRAEAGRFRKDANGKITDFEEIFLTPILSDEEAHDKGVTLLHEYISTGNIEKYKNDITYVEFPNLTWTYNKKKQAWINAGLDSLLRKN
ncbi:MAG: hypothetical protein J7604_08145 [Sporocytophaga sp.]|uniref:hypothetical protein n=1 Tax=Sporocytophaga sp. TaxID=2231183 RepID=UPI001B25BDD3|nr:hypothetical protein [Sporocytophaga sp.]MBO9700169.1 hypothetical protein [Sporocytophaga sp.]